MSTWIGLLLMLLPALCFCQPKYEFRAAWVATVENIDWPSKKGLPADSQKVEFIRLLDMHKRNGLNAVIVQIRPATDACYPSQYEPWSEWLTGKQGKPPVPYYDPLQFMIEETHKRGMEFHAWCNPYRAVFSILKSSVAPSHITRLRPDWFISYGGTKYFDPGNKEVQQYVTQVIRDIVHRYDVDAIHFDDYFYPYRVPGKEFQDDASYRKYGNGMSKDDWRRSNVDSIIVQLSKTIKEERKYCKFGISPFGVWRNKSRDADGSDTQAGQTNYDDLYADILLWLKNGWIDYVAPQIYWEIGFRRADYSVLVDWWSKHSYGRPCYIGLGIYRAGSNAAWRDRTLLTRQIQELRKYPDVDGAIYFSSKSFESNPNGWSDSLRNNYYNYPALISPFLWIDSTEPSAPLIHSEFNQKDSSVNTWFTKGGPQDDLRGYAIYRSVFPDIDIDSEKVFRFIPYDPVADFVIKGDAINPLDGKKYYYFATAISRTNVESEPISIPVDAATAARENAGNQPAAGGQ